MNIFKRLILVPLLVAFSLLTLRAQTPHKVGIGVSIMESIFPERYIYSVKSYRVEWNYTFARFGGFEFETILIPQYNMTGFYRSVGSSEWREGFEVGFTLGINCRFNFARERLFISAMGVIGPMYTPGMPARQGAPLNFSDNLAIGAGVRIAKNYMFELGVGFRHLSNAGINPPNYGLNTVCYTLAVKYCFFEKKRH